MRTKQLVLTALFAALTYVATNIIRVPIPATDGYINLKGHSFGELISTFGRAFAVKIDTTALPMPEGRYKWGKIRIADGIDNALKVLQNSYAFDYTFDSDARLVVLRPHK